MGLGLPAARQCGGDVGAAECARALRAAKFTGSLYFRMTQVAVLWEQLQAAATICYPLEDFAYGMREFAIYDNNGYILQFGEVIAEGMASQDTPRGTAPSHRGWLSGMSRASKAGSRTTVAMHVHHAAAGRHHDAMRRKKFITWEK